MSDEFTVKNSVVAGHVLVALAALVLLRFPSVFTFPGIAGCAVAWFAAWLSGGLLIDNTIPYGVLVFTRRRHAVFITCIVGSVAGWFCAAATLLGVSYGP